MDGIERHSVQATIKRLRGSRLQDRNNQSARIGPLAASADASLLTTMDR